MRTITIVGKNKFLQRKNSKWVERQRLQAMSEIKVNKMNNEIMVKYPDCEIPLKDIDKPLLLDEMVEINENSDINKIKAEIKSRVDKIADLLVEKRGSIKDCMVVISDKPGFLKKVQGPVWENIENCDTKTKYIRYGRSVKFI